MKLNRVVSSFLALAVAMTAAPAISGQAATAAPASSGQQQARPNVLVWMLDDVGFAQLSSYGGLVQTPNIDRVAKMGLRYVNYRTAPICSASRAAFLTGRNPHSVNVGNHAAAARPIPGYNAQVPASAGTIAANLREAGYLTFALGKWDHLPNETMTMAGPFTWWPTGQGFDQFYGFLAAETDNWNPVLWRNTVPARKPADPSYHLDVDLASEAIAMINARGARDPAPPFFLYWATGTAHTPHHAPQKWIDHYRGAFDKGWDQARADILQAQKRQKLVPASTRLAQPPEGMPNWNSLSADQKRLYTRQMEVFAAQLSHADEQFGRILDTLEARGELDNSIVIITSDNGASAEGGFHGSFNAVSHFNGKRGDVATNMPHLDGWGGPENYPHYTLGWAVAGNTPFRYYKQSAHEGGIHVPLVISWPRGIAARNELRRQFVHVSDLAPSLLEMTGVPLAGTINNVRQSPMEGQSITYSFGDPQAPDRKQAQYFEVFGNKGLWADNWTIVTSHRTKTWDATSSGEPNEPWELYDLSRDPGQTTDLAARYPERVARMSAMFDDQARRFNVLPIAGIGGSGPHMIKKHQDNFARRGGKWRYSGPVSRIVSDLAPPITALGYRMSATLDLPAAGISGPIFASGGALGGVGLYLDQGKPMFLMNNLEGESVSVAATEALPAGRSTIELEFRRPPAKAAPLDPIDVAVTIKSNGRILASGTRTYEMPISFGITESFDIGSDDGSAVMPGHVAGTPFPGTISDIIFDFNK